MIKSALFNLSDTLGILILYRTSDPFIDLNYAELGSKKNRVKERPWDEVRWCSMLLYFYLSIYFWSAYPSVHIPVHTSDGCQENRVRSF